jgi:hypothetical protein
MTLTEVMTKSFAILAIMGIFLIPLFITIFLYYLILIV